MHPPRKGEGKEKLVAATVSSHRRFAHTARRRQFRKQRLREIEHLVGDALLSPGWLVLGQEHAGEFPSLGVDPDNGGDRAQLPREIADTFDLRAER